MKCRLVLAAILTMGVANSTAIADDLAVTVYNNNLGVVSELRTLVFKKGTNRLSFIDVPTQIDPASVRFELAGGSNDVAIYDQNYAYDLVSPEQVLTKYIDQVISLTDEKGNVYAGQLLASDGGKITLLDTLTGKVKNLQTSWMVETTFPKLPDGLVTRPTLFWLYNSKTAGSKQARVSYQTTGLSWTAEYVGVLDKNEKQLDLSGWASITNNSGKTYADAKLKLVAGEINRARTKTTPYARGLETMAMLDGASQSFEEKSFFEYHLYTLPRSATLANNELKQLSLFAPAETGVKKIYRYRPQQNPTDVEVAVEFVNAQASGLGMPIPAGRVRMFKADDDGSLILLGEDNVEHTPKDEKVTLVVGNAFDIKAEEQMTNQVRVSDRVEDQTWQIELRNRKTEPVTISVEKNLYGFWEIQKSSHTYKKKNASTVLFEVPVGAGQVDTLTLSIRLSYR